MLGVVSRAASLVFLMLGVLPAIVLARDPDGRYGKMNPQLHAWFEKLANRQHGMCCSMADGASLAADDWGTETGPDGKQHYWVNIDPKSVGLEGQPGKVEVPDEALVDDPNRLGPAVVWPYQGWVVDHPNKAEVRIRCFLPGAMT